MKILFVGRFFYPEFGGGEFYIKNVLKYLVDKGHYCTAMCFYDGNTNQKFTKSQALVVDGIRVLQSQWCNPIQIQNVCKASGCDVMITQSTDSMMFLQAAKQVGVKTVFGIHFYNEICSMTNGGLYVNVLNALPEEIKIDPNQQKPFSYCDEFFVNSDYMSQVVEKYVGKKPKHVIYPPINKDFIAQEKKPSHVTYVNPCIGKGMGVFYSVAKKLPNIQFKMLGALVDKSPVNIRVYENIKKLPNVEILDTVQDMGNIYRSTKVLMTPSLVDETFSMVTLEALMNGIPVIASKFGNLPYLLEKGGYCLDVDNINEWVDKINILFNNQDEYDKVVKEGMEQIKKYDSEVQCEKFLSMLEGVVSG